MRSAEQIAADSEFHASFHAIPQEESEWEERARGLLREAAEALRDNPWEDIAGMWERRADRSESSCREVIAILEPLLDLRGERTSLTALGLHDALAAARKGIS